MRKAAAFWKGVVVLCLGVLANAQDEESAAIIQTSIMSFQVSGDFAGNFSQSAQADFSDNLRTLLGPFNFMSVAVNDFKAYDNYVDVSVRAVYATDAQNLTDTWAKISNQVISGTFASAFNALLANSGVLMNATVVSMEGATTPAGTNVDFAVMISLSKGMNLLPFDSAAQESFLTPINTFLGDHGNASIASFKTSSDGVDVDLNVTLDANTQPQFFFFIQNSSTLQLSMPTLGGESLETSVRNTTVYGSNAPPAATAPAALKAAAPAPVADSDGTVTAQDATGISSVPPVSASTSGTVTMNIELILFGSDTQPFDSSKQFAAASAMASVFWIIVGTGSVNIITFSAWNATSRPPSTALGTAQQYGRKLLQSEDLIPAENVTFAVTLPSASQNSLLVLQNSSDQVKKQFSGWYVTQMAARDLTVDVAVNSVSLSGISTQASTPPGETSPSTSSGSGRNVGAIVGGVVGGVVGALLLALIAFFLFSRSQKKKKTAANAKAKGMESGSSDDFKGTVYWESPNLNSQSPMYTRDADALKKTIATMLSTEEISMRSTDSGFFHSPLHSRLTDVDSEHAESVKLLAEKKQRESMHATETSSHRAEALLSALGGLEAGTLFYDKYLVDKKQRKCLNSVIAYASLKDSPDTKVVIKFLPNEERYAKEKLFYENRQALEGKAATEYIPFMLDAFDGDIDMSTESHADIPSSLVLERGSFTLAEYLAGKADLAAKPEEVDRGTVLFRVCKCVEFLHARHLVHGALTADHIMWFSNEKRWKIMGFHNCARSNESMRVDYCLRHAAPELVLADFARMKTLAAKESTDVWALGCIAYEILSGAPLFGSQYSDEEVMAMLLGFVKLPWESNPDFFVDNLQPSARTFVSDLLRRAPEARKPMATLLYSPIFSGLNSPQTQSAGPVTELQTPANLHSINW